MSEQATKSAGRNRIPDRPQLLVFDFDGVLTDNRVLVMENGMEAVTCNRADGLGFEMLQQAGIQCLVLSTEKNPVVSERCKKLGVECVQGAGDKRKALEDSCHRLKVPINSTWYVGNDLNDLQAMKAAGHAICPADAHAAVRSISEVILSVPGGGGVVREIAAELLGLEYGATNKKRTAIFVTVRTGSTRLPRKCFLDLNGQSVIEFLIRRLKKSRLADTIVLCTTTNQEDGVLCDIARAEGIECFRGSEQDKLERWRGAAEQFSVEFFVTADGDDPFCEPELIDLAFAQYRSSGADFIESEGLAVGSFTYGVKTSALEIVCRIKDTDDTEMMWVYFTDSGRFRTEKLQNVADIFKRPEIRMTLDYPDDFRFFEKIVGHFQEHGAQDFTLRDVITYLDLNPEIVRINQHLQEQFLANQKSKTKLRLKPNS